MATNPFADQAAFEAESKRQKENPFISDGAERAEITKQRAKKRAKAKEDIDSLMVELSDAMVELAQVGEKGTKGDKGDKGDSIKGDPGKDGSDGIDGKDGIGIKGDKGDKGDFIIGPPGPRGPTGKDGRGIKEFSINDDTIKTIFSDGTVEKHELPKGEKKQPGYGVVLGAQGIKSNPANVFGAGFIENVISLTTAQYTAATKDANTLYLITDA